MAADKTDIPTVGAHYPQIKGGLVWIAFGCNKMK